jgi:hypothetical protein
VLWLLEPACANGNPDRHDFYPRRPRFKIFQGEQGNKRDSIPPTVDRKHSGQMEILGSAPATGAVGDALVAGFRYHAKYANAKGGKTGCQRGKN